MDPRRIETLRAIMKALRTPVTGCPWDLEQNFETIAPYTIEEAYEVADAIERGDRKPSFATNSAIFLLQAVYHAQLAEEEGAFNFDDVVEAMNRKMIRRHPHVFGDSEARSADARQGLLGRLSSPRRRSRQQAGVLADVPVTLPGLTRAMKLQSKAAKVGFDWPDVSHVYDKLDEEIGELKSAPRDKQQEEFGDLLFVVANLARHLGIDPEAALRCGQCQIRKPVSVTLRKGLPKKAKNRSTRISPKWMACGKRPRLRAGELPYSAAARRFPSARIERPKRACACPALSSDKPDSQA